MMLEWLIIGLLLAATLALLGRRLRSPGVWLVLVLFLGLTISATALWQGKVNRREKSRAALLEKTPQQARPGGYVSSDQCRSCHPDQYNSWHRSYHRTMTQLPSAQSVRGNFDNVTLQHAGETYHLARHGDEFWVDMVDPDWKYVEILKQTARQGGRPASPFLTTNAPRARKQITMLTGSHHMQAYWVASRDGNMQFGFPFTYVFAEQRWLPRNDVFLLDPSVPWVPQVWNVHCINCHATAGQPRQDPQSKVIVSRAAELGIACEACHGPAEEHVRVNSDPARRYAQHHSGRPDPTIYNPARQNHIKSSETCGQCHAIRHNLNKELWNQEGLHFWPGEDIESKAPLVQYDGANLNAPGNEKKRALMEGCFWNDGQVRVSGRDFSGMAASACYKRGELSCLSCHSMHNYQDNDDQLRPRMEGNHACLQCHTSFATKIDQHTHHAAGSSGSLCYNCHMPHTSYGLLKAIRSHTINSPSVQSSLDTGRPNACNLCHLDKPLGWTAARLNEWYRQPVPSMTDEQKDIAASATWLLKGDAGQRALIAWHMGWEPAKAVSGASWLPRYLAEILVDPYSTVRYIAGRSLKAFPGYGQFSYDYIAPANERAAARERALEIWRGHDTNRPGSLPSDERTAALLRQRNDRHMELLE